MQISWQAHLMLIWRSLAISFLLKTMFHKSISLLLHCVKIVQIRSFFWSVFSRIWTEYGDLLRKSPHSVQMRENTDQKKLFILTIFTQYWKRKVFKTQNTKTFFPVPVNFLAGAFDAYLKKFNSFIPLENDVS